MSWRMMIDRERIVCADFEQGKIIISIGVVGQDSSSQCYFILMFNVLMFIKDYCIIVYFILINYSTGDD